MTPRVVATHVWPPESATPLAVAALEMDWGGPMGDRHHGVTMSSDVRQKHVYDRGTTIRNHRQVSIVDTAELARVATNLGIPELATGVIADNICTEGIPELTTLPGLTRLVFEGGVVLLTGGANSPCTIAGGMVSARYDTRPESFPKAAIGLRGITGWVEHPGTIRPGETITVVPPSGM